MAFYTFEQVRAAAQDVRRRTQKTDQQLLREARDTAKDSFDIFLSHSSRDKELVIGAKKLIEDRGYTVYVDWIDDAELDRAAVDRERADHLRRRMRQCESLFYAHTPNAALSRWCPWELGFFDGLRQPERRVFVFPILRAGEPYKGQEYLALYDTVDLANWTRPTPHRRPAPLDPLVERLAADRLGLLRRPGVIL